MRPQPPGGGGSSNPPHDLKSEELRKAEWYFGKITREEAKTILTGKPDGSFLVRDAISKEDEYTLTLIKDGTEKLIKICHLNGKYGFVDCKFDTVVDLINYYRVNSLKLYNKTLDITLSNPMVRPADDEESQLNYGDLRYLCEKFLQAHNILMKHQHLLDQKMNIFKSIEMELNEKKNHQDVFSKAEKMFQNQIMVLDTYISKTGQASQSGTASINDTVTQQDEYQQLQANASLLRSRLTALCTEMGRLNRHVEEKKDEYKRLERHINAARPELQKMTASKEKFEERLMEAGITQEDLNELIERGYDAWHQRYESITNRPHNNAELWLLREHSRHAAEELLKDCPTGTFLIRARSAGHYALSIVCKDVVNHCIIYETNKGYGFAAPYDIYSSLMQLVLHYSTNSLEEHNDTLTTTLRFPVLYYHQNKDTILKQLEQEKEQEEEQRQAEELIMHLQYQLEEPHMLQEDNLPPRDSMPIPGEEARTSEIYGTSPSSASVGTLTTNDSSSLSSHISH